MGSPQNHHDNNLQPPGISVVELRGHLQTKIFTLNVIVTLKGGGGGLWQMNMTLIFEISIARAQKDINSMQVQ